MSWHQVERQWKELQGRFGEKWRKLVADNLAAIAGKRGTLAVGTVRGAECGSRRSRFHPISASEIRQGGRHDVT